MLDNDETSGPKDPSAARDQEAEFFGVATGFDYQLSGGATWTLPFPRYYPPDMRMRYLEHIRFMAEDVDTEAVEHPVTGKKSKRAKFPVRVDNKLIDEDALLCVALMGSDAIADRDAYLKDGTKPETYAQFLAAGGVPGQVQARLQMMNRQMEERLRRDPQFRGGA